MAPPQSFQEIFLLFMGPLVVLVGFGALYGNRARRLNRRQLERYELHRDLPPWVHEWWQEAQRGAREAQSTRDSGSMPETVAHVIQLESASNLELIPGLRARRRGFEVWVGRVGLRQRKPQGSDVWITTQKATGVVLVELTRPVRERRLQAWLREGHQSWAVAGNVLVTVDHPPSLVQVWPDRTALRGLAAALERVSDAMDRAALLAEELCEPEADATLDTSPGP